MAQFSSFGSRNLFRMRVPISIASLWPGLSQAWILGSLRGLGLAIAFGMALNLALVSSLVWPQWPIVGGPAGATAVAAWVCVLGLWVLGLIWTQRTWLRLCPPSAVADPQIEEWFREAQIHYLKGHWIEAETLLARLLARQPADSEARLLLASVQRRARQWSQARKTLNELREQSTAARWQREIEIELSQLAELEQTEPTTETTASSDVQQAPIRHAA